ncbi:restriction endonuclease subunit S [Pseudomonas reactans]
MTLLTAPVGELTEILSGFAFKSERFNNSGEGLPLIRIRDVVEGASDTYYSGDYKSEFLINNGDALIGMDGQFNLACWRGGPALLNQRVCKIKATDERLDQSYLLRVLPLALKEIEDRTPFVTVKHLSVKSLREIEISLPPLSEQRRIAAILDKADALRAKRRETIAKLDQLLKSVFLEMFGDPVTNPKGWAGNTTLGDIALDMQYGPRFHNEAYSLNGIKIVRITDLSQTGELDFDAMPRMDVEDDVQVRFMLQPGDIIFARTGATVGKVALIQASDPPSIAGAYFIRIQVNNLVLPEYVFAALRTKTIQKFIAEKSRQAAQQNFSGPGLRKLPMPVPPLELQLHFAGLARKIEQQRRALQEHIEQQDALFASLQDRAFNGEL